MGFCVFLQSYQARGHKEQLCPTEQKKKDDSSTCQKHVFYFIFSSKVAVRGTQEEEEACGEGKKKAASPKAKITKIWYHPNTQVYGHGYTVFFFTYKKQ